MKKNKYKLKWKQKWSDDKSGYWFSAKVPFINWEYIVDVYQDPTEFVPSVFYSAHADDTTPIVEKNYKTKEAAIRVCEKHLEKTIRKLLELYDQL